MHHADFFAAHAAWGWLVLVGLAVFPRITLLFVGGPFGVFAWLGWLVCPHLLVAILATSRYWDTNPALCVVAWFVAFAGTGGEGRMVHHGARRARLRRDARSVDMGRLPRGNSEARAPSPHPQP
jgi:hypothetical protein